MTLIYNLNGTAMRQRVPLERTQCTFGGTRPWFNCPRCWCRIAVLYLRANGFACRHCQRVVYASQSEDLCGRTWRRQTKLEARLGEHWQRPKGMHQTTYANLMATIIDFEERREAALAVALGRMFPGRTIGDLLGR